MVNFDKDKIIAILLIVSMVLFAAVILADLSLVFSYMVLVWIIALMLLGVISYGFEDPHE